jgi:hypothetical protein
VRFQDLHLFVPVALPSDDGALGEAPRHDGTPDFTYLLGAGVSNTVAERLAASGGVRVGLHSERRSGPMASLDALYANDGLIAEWRVGASAGWAWALAVGRATPYVGVKLGGGFMLQDPATGPSRASPFGAASPVLGSTIRITSNIKVWSESQLSLLLYRRDSNTVVSLAPELWAGGRACFLTGPARAEAARQPGFSPRSRQSHPCRAAKE